MENTFFAPIGKTVTVCTIDNQQTTGEFSGIINFGGIPAIWLKPLKTELTTSATQNIFLLNNVSRVIIDEQKIDGGMFV